jgi:hypothetical protein
MLENKLTQISDQTLGSGIAVAGGLGFTIQSITQWANLGVTIGNIVLVAGGIWLMWRKIKMDKEARALKKRRASDKETK